MVGADQQRQKVMISYSDVGMLLILRHPLTHLFIVHKTTLDESIHLLILGR